MLPKLPAINKNPYKTQEESVHDVLCRVTKKKIQKMKISLM